MERPDLKQWRDQLIGDADNLLLHAARRYLGPVKTPFNKHQLASSLEAWLRNADNLEGLAGLLSSFEWRICAFLQLLGPLPPAVLLAFCFEATAPALLSQMQERLLIFSYPGPDGRDSRLLALNPILSEKLGERFCPADILSGLRPLRQASGSSDGRNRHGLFERSLVFMSVAVHCRPLYKRPGSFFKKAQELLDSLMPNPVLPDWHLLCASLGHCGCMVEAADGNLIPDPHAYLELVDSFGPRVDLALMAAWPGLEILPGGFSDSLGLFERLCETFPRRCSLTEADALSYLFLVAKSWYDRRGLQVVGNEQWLGLTRGLLDALVAAAWIERADGRLWAGEGMPDGCAETASAAGTAAERSCLVIEDSHEIQLLPGASCRDRAWVAIMARPQRADVVWTALLDKAGVTSLVGYGFKVQDLAGGLEALSGRRLPQSLRFSLESWQSEQAAVRLRQGTLVVLDEHLSHSLEHSRRAASIILEKLKDGVYLLAARSLTEAEKLLAQAGIVTDCRGQLLKASDRPWPSAANRASPEDVYRARQSGWGQEPPLFPAADWEDLATGQGSGLKARDTLVQERVASLLAELESMAFDNALSEVLAEKIRSRLIIDAAQLRGFSEVSDIVAGAMDYPGKVRYLERSMQEGLPVEIGWTGPGGEKLRLTGYVSALRKQDDGMLVELAPVGAPAECRRLPVRLLARVRLLLNL